jgi:hypothetical protein
MMSLSRYVVSIDPAKITGDTGYDLVGFALMDVFLGQARDATWSTLAEYGVFLSELREDA